MNIDVNLAQDVAAAFTGSLLTSIFNARRLAKKKAKVKDPNRCTCKHNVSFHDAQGCHAQVDGKAIKFDAYNDPTAWEQVDCGCRRFVGPNSSYDPGLDADLAAAQNQVNAALPPANQPRISPLPPYDAPSHLPRQRDTRGGKGGQRDV